MLKLLIASNNSGKLKEFRSLLEDLDIQLFSPSQLGIHLVVNEKGKSYVENASLKANAFARASGLITLSDDSGLEVDALNGSPGICSARFSPRLGADDADRRNYLLEKLENKPRPWSARFRCCLALVSQGKKIRFSEGVCHGEIIPDERGENGFGYDPIFYIPNEGRTMAELSIEEKNRLSHRALAALAARPDLEEMLADFN